MILEMLTNLLLTYKRIGKVHVRISEEHIGNMISISGTFL